MTMYVSDVLDSLLDVGPVRELVRARCVALTDHLPPHVRQPLHAAATHFGAKCMGYPAVWFVKEALELDLTETARVLDGAWTSLCISLSTSIADDLTDKDEQPGGDALMYFYLLLFKALEQGDWHKDGLGPFVLAKSVDIMPLFVGRTPDAPPLPPANQRIGHFHRMIAYDMLRHVPMATERRAELIELTGRFGQWCADMDDVLDVESDLFHGGHENFAVELTLEHHPSLGGLRSRASIAQASSDDRVVAAMVHHMTSTLRSLSESCKEWGASALAHALGSLEATLPTQLPQLRRAVRAEFEAPAPTLARLA
jgi:hypothetical protein